ncbi:MAG: hypothetical protein QOH57_779 [Mycobacterium sp.]|jgi:hypothetical protein|nr:hypothetical protein [Mycobacterium sp.]
MTTGGDPNRFGSPPASAETGYQACNMGLRGLASASLRCASTAALPKGLSCCSLFRNYAGPQHFCLYAACSAWVPGSALGSPIREVEPSLPTRPWPHRASLIPLYSVTMITSRVVRDGNYFCGGAG